jgi:3-oxoacyl-[acyl-carrier protein] reductase
MSGGVTGVGDGGLLPGKVALVTGAGQGIGLAVARAFREHGATVALVDLDAKRAREAAEDLAAAGVVGLGCDVTDEDDVAAAVDSCRQTFGGLDVYVNNAGITRDASLRKMTVSDFDAVIAVHLRGTWLGVRAAAEVMRANGRGSIINMTGTVLEVGGGRLI